MQTKAEQWLEAKNYYPGRSDPFTHGLNGFKIRGDYRPEFGLPIVTGAMVEKIVKYAPLVEVGAGTGYLAYEIREAGGDVIATEPTSVAKNPYGFKHQWIETERMSAMAAVKKYQDRNLLISWPCYDRRWSEVCLRAFVGRYVLYIGEGRGGCTGNESFHELLENRYELKEEVEIPQFYGLHDALFIYER